MKVLLDHNVSYPLAGHLERHEVETADGMGWATLSNGALLRAAEEDGFDVLVTADKNLSCQQNMRNRKLALVVLSSNDWSTIQPHSRAIAYAVDSSSRGSFQRVDCR